MEIGVGSLIIVSSSAVFRGIYSRNLDGISACLNRIYFFVYQMRGGVYFLDKNKYIDYAFVKYY